MIELIFSFCLLIGSHEMGHQVEADRLNVEIIWNRQNSFYPSVTKKELDLITNRAFIMQDEIGYRLNSRKYNLISGVYKIQYLYRDVLDMKNITKESKYLIAITAMSDIGGGGLRFTQLNENTTGLKKTWRF